MNWESHFWIIDLLLIIYLYQQNCESQRYVKLGLDPSVSLQIHRYVFSALPNCWIQWLSPLPKVKHALKYFAGLLGTGNPFLTRPSERKPFLKCLKPDLCTAVPEAHDIVFLQTEWNWKIPFKTVLWRFQLASQRNTLETQRSFQWWYSISKEILVFYSSGLYWSTGTIPPFFFLFFFCLSRLGILDIAAKGRQLACLLERINLGRTVTWASSWRSKINFNHSLLAIWVG